MTKAISFCLSISGATPCSNTTKPAAMWGCDYTGKVTLMENSEPEYPNAEILFIANAP